MDIADVEERHLETEEHYGRTFQRYSLLQQINFAPVDEREAHRQRQQHALLKDFWTEWPQHRLFPAFVGSPLHILDCGAGAGAWAYEVAGLSEQINVRALDISPQLASRDKPPNVFFQITNLNEIIPIQDDSFQFVHSRFVGAGIGRFRWPSYLSEIYRLLQVGGWVQIVEWEFGFRSNNGKGHLLSGLQEWVRLYNQALGATGYPDGKKSTSIAQDCGAWLRTALFERVQTAFKEIPTCGWSTDPRWRRIGEQNLVIMQDIIGSLATHLVVSRDVAPLEDWTRICAQAREDLARIEAEPYVRLYACWARKEARSSTVSDDGSPARPPTA